MAGTVDSCEIRDPTSACCTGSSDPRRSRGADTLDRIEEASGLGTVLLASRVVENEEFPGATVRTPAIIELDGSSDVFKHEMFGPIIFVVKAASTT